MCDMNSDILTATHRMETKVTQQGLHQHFGQLGVWWQRPHTGGATGVERVREAEQWCYVVIILQAAQNNVQLHALNTNNETLPLQP